MNKSFVVAFVAGLLAAPCMAVETGMCKSICAQEKRECRSAAAHRASIEVAGPLASMAASPHEIARSKIDGSPQDAKALQQSEYRKRKHEREDICDGTAMACARACSAPEPATPKTQH